MSEPPAPAESPDLFDVQNHGIIVTGAASGIGLAIADVLAQRGAVVTLADIDESALTLAVRELSARGLKVHADPLDITDEAALDRLMATAVERAGRLDCVFANAGAAAGPGPSTPAGTLELLDLDVFRRSLELNLTGTLATMRAAVAPIRAGGRGGRIVVTASVAGLQGDTLVGYAYVAAKAAVVNLVHQAALELAQDRILVNGIAPGPFRTGFANRATRDPRVERVLSDMVPLGRIAEPLELQGLALLLASPASSYITGTVIPVDGGMLAGQRAESPT